MDLIEVIDEINKETKKLEAIADLMATCNIEIEDTVKDGIIWIISDSARNIKNLVNECLK